MAWVRQHPDLVSRQVGGETIVVPLRRHVADLEAIYVLNETAADLWQWLPQTASLDDLVARLLATYDVTEAEARADVEGLLAQWKTEGLVEDSPG